MSRDIVKKIKLSALGAVVNLLQPSSLIGVGLIIAGVFTSNDALTALGVPLIAAPDSTFMKG